MGEAAPRDAAPPGAGRRRDEVASGAARRRDEIPSGAARRRDEIETACWQALRRLAAAVRARGEPVRSCWLLVGEAPAVALDAPAPPPGDGWRVRLLLDPAVVAGCPPPAAGESRYLLEDVVALRPLARGDLPPPAAALVETYAPYCFAPLHARRAGRAFTVSHFAQSLDGRIAAGGGDSKWIGCAENLLHAHRMRALCDGVLIGARTLRTDRPALTVRHAAGADPARIVVGATKNGDLDCLLAAGPGRILLAGEGEEPPSPQVERLDLARRGGRIATAPLLAALYRRGVHSVYIEGGAVTTSAFLGEGTIDVVQLHISPLILGAGLPSFSRPEVRAVAESVRFAAHLYRPVGDGILFVGLIDRGRTA